MANQNVPTPQNIVSITYQLLQNSADPTSIRAQLPALTIQFLDPDSVQRNKAVTFQEMLPYLRMLHVKALADGKVLTCFPESTFDKKIVILPGVGEVIPNPSQTIFDFIGIPPVTINPIVNVDSVVGNIVNSSNNPSYVSLSLPVINGDFFENDYNITDVSGFGDIIYIGQPGSSGFWDVLVMINPNALSAELSITAKELRANFFIRNSGSANITNINGITSGLDADLKVVNGDGYKVNQDVAAPGGLIIPLQNGEISAWRYMGSAQNLALLINGDFSVSSAQDMNTQVAGGNKQIITTTNVPSSGNQDIACNIEFYNAGQINPVSRVAYINILSGGAPTPPPVGVPVNAAAGNTGTSAALCPAPQTTYYTNDGTITTGKTVFTDIGLTTPLAGFDFIMSPDGNIYAINNVTGVVGAATGNTCALPTSGKNMFIVGVVATQLDVDGTDYGAHGAGSNYNVNIKSNSVITNNSGGSRTFNFYTSPPFIIGNITPGSGSPVVVANGGTYTLPNVISNYNYLRIT